MQYQSQWQERIGRKLFPRVHLDTPSFPEGKDELFCKIVCEFSFLDRLRILLTGRASVETRTVTENMIGAHATSSTAFPLPPKWMERRPE
jgi:hypothetical protein